jgi:hypothetical protein
LTKVSSFEEVSLQDDHKCGISPQKESAMIEAKTIFGKKWPKLPYFKENQIKIQTLIASCMPLGHNRVPNNLYFPL